MPDSGLIRGMLASGLERAIKIMCRNASPLLIALAAAMSLLPVACGTPQKRLLSSQGSSLDVQGLGLLRVDAVRQVDMLGSGGYTEVPPLILAGLPWGYLLSSDFTVFCVSSTSAMSVDSISFDSASCHRVLASDASDNPPPDSLPPGPIWRRNYLGAYSAFVLGAGGANSELVAFTHGENKNERRNNQVYLNTVNTNVGADCVSGWDDVAGAYVDCWDAYNAFVGMAHAPYQPGAQGGLSALVDEGPIVWPSAGYLADGVKTSFGVRHPTSFVDADWIYVFYLDESFSSANGRQRGIKVARAPIASKGVPGSFLAYYAGAFTEPALPSGFAVNDSKASLNALGPLASPVPPDSAEDNRFSVAWLPGQNIYLGVEERNTDAEGWSVALRTSHDLLTWSERQVLSNLNAPTPEAGMLNYPVLLDSIGSSNSDLDPRDFYLLGTHDSLTERLHLGLE
jgi:hypothetical protein